MQFVALSLVAGALLHARPSTAAPPNETVFSSSAMILSGEHTPFILASQDPLLTGPGAQQLYSVGQFLRSRYIDSNSSTASQTVIPGLNPTSLNASQLFILSNDTQYDSAGAAAFLQGLYPPANTGVSRATAFPLNGYQYGWIHTADFSDISSMWIDGTTYCKNAYGPSAYSRTDQYSRTKTSFADFYNQVAAIAMTNDVPSNSFSYDDASYIYDYVNYMATYNSSIRNALQSQMPQALDELRYLADGFNWNTYGAVNNDPVNRVAGRTAAFALYATLLENTASSGAYGKINALFTGLPTMVSLFSILDLPVTDSDFYGRPLPGSALIFELFANNDGRTSYPSTNDMRVRVMFRNGTADTALLKTFIMGDTGSSDLSLATFAQRMMNIGIGNDGDWCGVCDSWLVSPFCLSSNASALVDAVHGFKTQNVAMSGGGLDPKLAGVIGAVATLGALGLFLVLGVGCCGLRLITVRHPPPSGTVVVDSKNPSGGFKGMQKLASDPDLKSTAAKNGAGITIVKDKDGGTIGHARMGSWELKDTGAAQRSMDEEMEIEGLGKRVEPSEHV